MPTPVTGADRAIAYLLMRIALGASLFGLGLARMPKSGSFSEWMVGQFHASMLPTTVSTPLSYLLPFADLIAGALILIGLFTRSALVAGGALIVALIFGSTTIENWTPIAEQLLHTVIVVGLLAFAAHDRFAVDSPLARSKTGIS